MARKHSRPAAALQPQAIQGARVFVLPNPSGRNANFSYAEMLAAFGRLKRALRERPLTRISHRGRRELCHAETLRTRRIL